MPIHKYDTVIVGAGGAGVRAAIESTKRSRTAVLTKLYPTRSRTGAAQGGMAAALANVEEDNWEWHTFDTIKGGDYLVDQDAAEILAKEAIDAVLDLEKMGLPFGRTPEGKIDQRRFGGHTRSHGEAPVRRACYSGDRTGHMILQTLYQNCVKEGVEFFNEFYVLDQLITEVDGVEIPAGVVAFELATGEIHVFQAKSVIYASGGTGKFFKVTSNAHTLTGDGQAACYRRGLPLEDMEFFQFHPTGIWRMGEPMRHRSGASSGVLPQGGHPPQRWPAGRASGEAYASRRRASRRVRRLPLPLHGDRRGPRLRSRTGAPTILASTSPYRRACPVRAGSRRCVGDITVMSDADRHPSGTMPLRGAVRTATDMSRTEEKIPAHAIVLAIIFALFCLIGLLFLLMKEKRTVGFVQVTVTSGGRHHAAVIPAMGPHTFPGVMGQLNQACSMSA
ncbi:hypothetical protein SMICM304S_00238 [Streptomyces microflavus]